ncbi:Uncharacterised protein [Avibacterium paragallinarum]|uniref:Uncharacterized protein n=1 Tax=Avibacterium paragallinarum TaxID=728 RepID=A0A380Z1Z1_AVIPA|nr:Uncharacterised protein [Avibacterium paragallinarum]
MRGNCGSAGAVELIIMLIPNGKVFYVSNRKDATEKEHLMI